MKRKFLNKGQNLTELALILGVVGLALIGMQVYAKRSLQGKTKDLVDYMIGKEHQAYQQDVSGLEINTSESHVFSNSTIRTEEDAGGIKRLSTVVPETTTSNYKSESKAN